MICLQFSYSSLCHLSYCYQSKSSLREKCPTTELFLVRIFLYSVQIQENTAQKNHRIWTLFTQCFAQIWDWKTLKKVEILSQDYFLSKLWKKLTKPNISVFGRLFFIGENCSFDVRIFHQICGALRDFVLFV